MSDKASSILPEALTDISFVSREDGSYLLEDHLRKERLALNETAHRICSFMNGMTTLEEIAAKIADEYQAPIEEVRTDVLNVYRLLKKHKLVLNKRSLQYVYLRFYYCILGV